MFMEVIDKISAKIRDIKDFPKPGIVFKDITPLLADAELCRETIRQLAAPFEGTPLQAVAGIESRGFIFGMMLAQHFNVPFVPIRKAGKLPFEKISHSYTLEYGEATIEVHTDAIQPGWNVLLHDDLLATGGTAAAAATLIHQIQGNILGYSFLVELEFLDGRGRLNKLHDNVHSLIRFR